MSRDQSVPALFRITLCDMRLEKSRIRPSQPNPVLFLAICAEERLVPKGGEEKTRFPKSSVSVRAKARLKSGVSYKISIKVRIQVRLKIGVRLGIITK